MDSQTSKPILLISPLPPPLGGIATWTQMFLDFGLPDASPVSFVNTRLRGKRNIFDKSGFSFTELMRTSRVFCSLLYQLFLNRPKLIHLSCALSPLGILRDLVCARLAKSMRVPVVTQYHGNLPDFDSKRYAGLSAKVLKALMQVSDMNIFTNQISLQLAKEICPNAKMDLLPNFIEDEVFQFKKIKQFTHRPQAIFAGGITAKKGCAEILELAHRFPTTDFHLYGKMHTDMEQCYERPPINIVLHGEVNRDALLQAMCKCDFLLFPSHTEGFPLTVLEAMAIGLPVIATKVGAIPDMIEDEKGGYLCPPAHVEALANALASLQNNAEMLAKMGAYNQKKSYQHYRYPVVAEQLHAIYGRILCVA